MGAALTWWNKVGIDPTVTARALWLETHPLPAILDKARLEDPVSLDPERSETPGVISRLATEVQIAKPSRLRQRPNLNDALRQIEPTDAMLAKALVRLRRRQTAFPLQRHPSWARGRNGHWRFGGCRRLQGLRSDHHCRLYAQSAVERELVLRLASLLWRLRRATTMETGLFEIQADHLIEFRQGPAILLRLSRSCLYAVRED
jgi:hypothetical protein